MICNKPNDEIDAEIALFFRGRLESEDTGRILVQLLSEHPGTDQRISLKTETIRELSEILDLAGFNQFSFPPETTSFVPDFCLQKAEVFPINHRPVLSVSGVFFQSTGAVDTR